MNADGPIAVFDSGIGGLSVVSELWRLLPGEEVLYFGDTARVPYGVKSPGTIRRFAREILVFLETFSPKLVVAACNTVSAVAIEDLREATDLAVVDVVGPGARAAAAFSRRGKVGVVATEATIASGAYAEAIRNIDSKASVVERAAPLIVPMVEEGRRHDSPLVLSAVSEYLAPMLEQGVDALVLGCTHYPVFKPAFQQIMGEDVFLVDSAEETAAEVAGLLRREGSLRPVLSVPEHRFYVSDNPERFQRIGTVFLLRRDITVILVGPDEFPCRAPRENER